MSSLTMVVSWLMEHALKYDMPELRNELKTLFPVLVTDNTMNIPNMDILVDLATLRLISRTESDMLDTLENLQILITNYENFYETESGQNFKGKPARKMQLEDFLNKLKMMKSSIQLKEMMTNLIFEYKTHVNEEFHSNDEESTPACKKLKLHCESEMLKKVQAQIVPENLEKDIENMKKEICQHTFIQTFDTFALENLLQSDTGLDIFIKHSHNFLPTEVPEVQLLANHLQILQNISEKNGADTRVMEKKLIVVAKNLGKLKEKKDPKFCPIIYLLDSVTGGVDGIKIKNAYEI